MQQFDPELADAVVRVAVFAADMETFKPRPISKVSDPDGTPQFETGAELTQRQINAAVKHLLEQGLIVLADDVPEKLERGIRMDREGRG